MEFASNTKEPVLHCSAGAQLEPDPSRPVLKERVSLKANPGTSRKETKHSSNDEKKSWPTSTWGQNFEASSKTHNAVSDDQQANKRLDVPASAAATWCVCALKHANYAQTISAACKILLA
jgi:hypothetical protein